MSICTVTGATGFIGSHLVKKLLENGETVRCLVRASSNLDRLNGLDVELRQTDFSDSDSLKRGIQGSDIVYHCAGCIATVHKEEMFQTNCENTKRLAQACMNSDSAPKFIYVSSLAAGGPMPGKDAPLREEWMTENPVSIYGKSKVEVGDVDISITKNGNSYVLTRTVNGTQNYQTYSTYKEQVTTTKKSEKKEKKKKEKKDDDD